MKPVCLCGCTQCEAAAAHNLFWNCPLAIVARLSDWFQNRTTAVFSYVVGLGTGRSLCFWFQNRTTDVFSYVVGLGTGRQTLCDIVGLLCCKLCIYPCFYAHPTYICILCQLFHTYGLFEILLILGTCFQRRLCCRSRNQATAVFCVPDTDDSCMWVPETSHDRVLRATNRRRPCGRVPGPSICCDRTIDSCLHCCSRKHSKSMV